MEEIGKGNVIALIVESLYAENPAKTPSELVAREMLKEVMLDTESKGKGFIVTTFSSHLARLKSIVEFGKKMNRKIVFLGRSLSKYVYAGQDIDLINFSKDAQIVKYKKQVISVLKKISKNKGKYLLVVTGHQGEPQATLAKMIRGDLPYHFDPEDHVVFASSVIPTEINRKNREKLEMQLKKKGARIYSNVHVSGHASREDLRDLLKLVKPANLIPAHGPLEMRKNLADLAYSMGFSKKQVHLMDNGSRKTF